MAKTTENEMSLVGHLTELRTRAIVCVLSLIICVCLALFIARPVQRVLTSGIGDVRTEPGRDQTVTLVVQGDNSVRLLGGRPTADILKHLSSKHFQLIWPADAKTSQTTTTWAIGEKPTEQFYFMSPIDPVMVQLKIALIVGILLALPVLLYQIWLFVCPGLKMKERRIIKTLLGGAFFLFPLGAAFAFYVVQLLFRIMQVYSMENVAARLDIHKYLSLLFNMMLVFGTIFELPLVMAILSRIGIINPSFLREYRRHAYVVLAFAAMILSPGADPFSMLVILFPLIGLYELSVLLCTITARMHLADQAASATEIEDDESDD